MAPPKPTSLCQWGCGGRLWVGDDQEPTPHAPRCPALVGLRARGWLRGVGRCTLAWGDNRDRRCAWCGRPLPARRRRWCSGDCELIFQQNHSWGQARAAVLKRGHHACTRCGAGPDRWRLGVVVVWLLMGQPSWRDPTMAWRWNGHFSHQWALEVNHRTPIRGRHAEFGCWHHLDGLEVLCHSCHLEETAAQRARGWEAAGDTSTPEACALF